MIPPIRPGGKPLGFVPRHVAGSSWRCRPQGHVREKCLRLTIREMLPPPQPSNSSYSKQKNELARQGGCTYAEPNQNDRRRAHTKPFAKVNPIHTVCDRFQIGNEIGLMHAGAVVSRRCVSAVRRRFDLQQLQRISSLRLPPLGLRWRSPLALLP
jgi:hypothetical protein